MSTICTDTRLETFSSLVQCSVNKNLSEIRPYRNQEFLQYLKDSKQTKKQNVGILYGVNLCILFS